MIRNATPIPTMRWRDYVLVKGEGLSSFWSRHLTARDRSVLVVLGRGFDPRSHAGLDMILAAGGGGSRNVLGLDYDEGEGSASLAYAPGCSETGSTSQERSAIGERSMCIACPSGRVSGELGLSTPPTSSTHPKS
jgi:hypothetical protein